MPATVAGLLAVVASRRAPGVARPLHGPGADGNQPWERPGHRPAAAGRRGLDAFDLELLCARPIHHVLEYSGLYGLLEGLQAAAPGLRVRVWLRSALDDDACFRHLPAAAVARLPGAGSRAAAALAALRRSGSARVLLGRDVAWERRLGELGAWRRAELPRDFQWRLPAGPAAAAAAASFFAAVAAASPRWLVAGASREARQAATGGPEPIPTRFLVYQARSHIGDALWLTPLLRAVRRRYPDAAITVLAAEAAAAVLAGNPHVAEILTVGPGVTAEAARRVLRRELARRRFDAALFAFVRRPQALWLAAAAAELGVPWRINLEYFDGAGDGREPSPLFTHEGWFFWGTLPSPRLLLHALDPLPKPPPEPASGRPRHDQSAEARPAPGMDRDRRLELPLADTSRRHAAAVLSDAGIGDEPYAVLAPAARSSPRWPARKFAALAVHLAQDLGLHVLIEAGASPGDTAVLAEVTHWLRALGRPGSGAGHDAPGNRRTGVQPCQPAPSQPSPAAASPRRIVVRQDPLGTLAALLERAHLLVGNDSAPIHLAEITATPTLYFAQREKLIHSHPCGPLCRALHDPARNRPARIMVSAALAAVAAMVRDQLVPPLARQRPSAADRLPLTPR